MNRNIFLFCGLITFSIACTNKGDNAVASSSELCLTDSLKQVVTIDTVHIAEITNELALNGRVTFDQEQVARVFPMFGGRITEVYAEIGDYVKKGQTLAIVRSGEVADYEKQLKDAGQQVALARRNHESTQDMYKSGMASERDLLQSKQELINAETELNRLKEVFSIYNLSGNSAYEVKSPMSGFIVEKNINKEMQIRPDQSEELFTVSGMDNVWVMADVYESDISKVKEGAPVRITTLAYPDKEFTGVIDKVYNMLDEGSKTMSVRVKLRNNDYMLKPGMFTTVYVECKSADVAMPHIDSHALIFESGKNYVVTVNTNGKLQVKEVEVYKQMNKNCYISSGLQEGDLILNRNALLVYNALNAD